MKSKMSNEKKSLVPDAKPIQRLLKVEISKGISKGDAIRILEKINLAIGNDETSWDTEFNNFVVLLEKETDSDDGICVMKQITWRDLKRRKEEILSSCKGKALRDYVNATFPVFPEDESATDEEFRRLNTIKKI